MCRGITGIAEVFASTRTKRARMTTLVTRLDITQTLFHGNSFPPKLNPTNCADSPRTRSSAPLKSIRFHTAPRLRSTSCCACGLNWSRTTTYPTPNARRDTGTCRRKHQRQPMVSAIAPPSDAPQIAPKPLSTFCAAWYMPRCWKGIMSELIIVATHIIP